MNVTLRDLARFGEMMRLRGEYHGQQIISAEAVDLITRGGNRELFAKAPNVTKPGWSYRSTWWVSHNERGVYHARGVNGQIVAVDPKAEMVIVQFSSFPLGSTSNLDPIMLPAYDALAEHLMRVGK